MNLFTLIEENVIFMVGQVKDHRQLNLLPQNAIFRTQKILKKDIFLIYQPRLVGSFKPVWQYMIQ